GNLGLQGGVLRVRLGLSRQLRIGLSAADFLEVNGDEMVRICGGLGAGQQLLSSVFVEVGTNLLGRQRFISRRGEEDLLLCELRTDLVADEVVRPGQEPAGDEKYDGDRESADRKQRVESLAAHRI